MTSQGMTGKSSMRGIYFKKKKKSSIIVHREKEYLKKKSVRVEVGRDGKELT